MSASAAVRATAESLPQAPGEVRAEQRAVTALLVGTAAEQREATTPGALPGLGELGSRRRPAEAGKIPATVGGPVDLAAPEGAQEREDRAQLPQPDVHAALPDPARPEPHDEDARAVVARGRVVDALGADARCMKAKGYTA